MHVSISRRPSEADHDDFYPHSDGRPVGETPAHFLNASDLRETLDARYNGDPQVFVAANMFIYYVKGDRWKHVSPDIFLVRGVPKEKPRKKYLLWEENKGPDLVIELTSESTRDEDLDKKMLYRDFLGVQEYVLFDPFAEYLHPQLQGFLLQQGDDVMMPVVSGRLVSHVLGLHLEPDGQELRLYDPASAQWLRNPREERAFATEVAAERDRVAAERDRVAAERDRVAAERDRVAAERDRATTEREQATAERNQATAERDQALADKARLERELAELRRRLTGTGGSEQT